MKTMQLTILIIAFAVILLSSAFVIRDGLLSIAEAIRDSVPDELTVTDLTIEHATVERQPSGEGNAHGIELKIENMRINASDQQGE